jgi:TetR/AcrR family transcriptional regulator
MTDTEQPASSGVPSDAAARILAAAETLFAEQGFNAVSMNAVAERAGVSKANIFHHFSSKKALYLAVLKAACRESFSHIEQLGSQSGTLAERLGNYASAHLASLLEHEHISRLIQRDLLENGPERGRELVEQVFGQNFHRLVEILRAGQAKGELRGDIDPAIVATLLIGANLFFFEKNTVLRHFPDVGFADSPERYSQMVVDIMLRGIAPPAKDKK